MKKWIFSVVAIVALSSVATFVTQNFRPEELTLAQLANIEALADPEYTLPDLVVECSSGFEGKCFYHDIYKGIKMCGEYMYYPCSYSGYQQDFCKSPCY